MKKILIFCVLLCTLNFYGQTKLEFSLLQDVRLLLVGDDKGNDPLTLNILSRLEVPVLKLNNNYLAAQVNVEYADLNGGNYQRYGLGLGYVIKSICKNIGGMVYADYGKIYRQEDGFNSYSISGGLSYRLTNKLKLICTHQITYRKDLKVLYNTKKAYIISGFFGIKYQL